MPLPPVVHVYGLIKCEEKDQSVQIQRCDEDNPDHYRLCRADEVPVPQELDPLLKDEVIAVYKSGELIITWTVN